MSRPQAMNRYGHDNPPRAKVLLFMLAILTLLGVAGTTASILAAQGQSRASAEDVAANRRLIDRLAQLEEASNLDGEQHRVRNEKIHADLCRLVYAVIEAVPTLANQGIQPCADPILQPEPPRREPGEVAPSPS